jgi:hypothetical protein
MNEYNVKKQNFLTFMYAEYVTNSIFNSDDLFVIFNFILHRMNNYDRVLFGEVVYV